MSGQALSTTFLILIKSFELSNNELDKFTEEYNLEVFAQKLEKLFD